MPSVSFQVSGRKFQVFWDAGSDLQGNKIPGGPKVTYSKKVWFEKEGVGPQRTDLCMNAKLLLIMVQAPKEDIMASVPVPHLQGPSPSTTST